MGLSGRDILAALVAARTTPGAGGVGPRQAAREDSAIETCFAWPCDAAPPVSCWSNCCAHVAHLEEQLEAFSARIEEAFALS